MSKHWGMPKNQRIMRVWMSFSFQIYSFATNYAIHKQFIMNNQQQGYTIDFHCLFLNKKEKNTYANKLEIAGFKKLSPTKKILEIEEKVIGALLSEEPHLVLLIIHQSHQRDIRSSSFIQWPLFKNKYTKILVLFDKQIPRGHKTEQSYLVKTSHLTFFRSHRVFELAKEAQKLQQSLSNPSSILGEMRSEAMQKLMKERKEEIQAQKLNKSVVSNMLSTSQFSVSHIDCCEKDKKQKQENSVVSEAKGTIDLSLQINLIQKEEISQSIKQDSNKKEEDLTEEHKGVPECASKEEEFKQQKLEYEGNEISMIAQKEENASNDQRSELADSQELDRNKNQSKSKGDHFDSAEDHNLELLPKAQPAYQAQKENLNSDNCEPMNQQEKHSLVLDSKGQVEIEKENNKSEKCSTEKLRIKRKDKRQIQDLKRRRLLNSGKVRQSLGHESQDDMLITSSQIKAYQVKKQNHIPPPKSTRFKSLLRSLQSELSSQVFTSLVVYWIDPRIESNTCIKKSLLARCNKKVEILQFKEMTPQIYAEISSNNSTEYVIICSNTTHKQVFESRMYPYANCYKYFIYCGKQEIARQNIQKNGIIVPVNVETDPESFEHNLFEYIETIYHGIHGRGFF